MDSLIPTIAGAVKEIAKRRGSDWWYTPHMAAASRAVTHRIPLVHLLLEVRDARIPLSSECSQLKRFSSSSRHVIVLNKTDLANPSQTKDWLAFFEEQKLTAFGVNSHNRSSIHKFLTFLQARVREMTKTGNLGHTITLMLVGIPNVGKSALANSLHQVGRISAAEKGRLKHSVVTPHPGETKNITSLKIASHPNIYVLDTPGILPPYLTDDSICSKLALTGAIKDCIVGDINLARYFLSILNASDEYKKWGNISCVETGGLSTDEGNSNAQKRLKRQLQTDHTQDVIVNNVRRILYDTISSAPRYTENGEEELSQLFQAQFEPLLKVFHLPLESKESSFRRVAAKSLNLYRTGRLGHYTLDSVPSNNAECNSI